jgi:hypothetical protein
MSDFYVDLEFIEDSHAGTESDPFSSNDFFSNIENSLSPNNYYIRGMKEINTPCVKDTVLYSNIDVFLNNITVTNNYPTGTPVLIVSSDPPAPLVSNTVYWVINVDSTTIRLATSYQNAIYNIIIFLTSAGTGSHRFYQLALHWPSNNLMHSYSSWDITTNGPWRFNILAGSYSLFSIQGYFSDAIIYFPEEDGHFLYFDNAYIFNSFFKLPIITTCLNNCDVYGSTFVSFEGCGITLDDTVVTNFYDSIFNTFFIEGTPGVSTALLVNCVTSKADYSTLKNDIDILLAAKIQYNWETPIWPEWFNSAESWSSEILGAGIEIYRNPGTPPYYGYNTGLFGEQRTGIGAFFFETEHDTDITNVYSFDKVIIASRPEVKISGKLSCIGWVKSIVVEDGDTLIPFAVSDPLGIVLNTDSALRFEILRNGRDYRLQYLGSKSKLIDKNLKIKLDDGAWHMLSYESDENGNMTFSVDGYAIGSEEGIDTYGLPYSVAKSLSSRVGGGSVWTPYIYKSKQIIYMYNWRFGSGFNLGLEWINKLKDIDKVTLKI